MTTQRGYARTPWNTVRGQRDASRRSMVNGTDVSAATAHFELAQHFHRKGLIDAAAIHFEEAMRLQPENWTYKCQAWACMNPGSKPTEGYNRAWLEAGDKIGIENYYERLDL